MRRRATIRIAGAIAALAMTVCQPGFGGPVPEPAAASGLTVHAVKFWSLGNSTRIAIEVSGEFQYHKDRLENPDRMFFDIAGAQSRLDGQRERGQRVIPVGDKFVKQIRIAEPKAGTTRVVLDLEPGADCTTSQLTDPDRLMIEVTAPGRPETPTVTPSVVVIKRFEPPPTITRKSAPPQIGFIDDPAPQIAMKTPVKNPLPQPKQRRLLASAAAPATPPPSAPEPPVIAAAPLPAPVASEGPTLPAKRNSTGDYSLTRVLGLKVKRVVIDAGHGGKDEGTRGPNGLLEKELVLDVAKRAGALLQDRLGVEVIYTRSDDTFIPKEQRTRIANEEHGDIFVSIHANSSNVRTVSGVEIYYLSFSNSKLDLETAARENADAGSSVHELQSLLQKTMLNDKLKESSDFASKVLQSMTNGQTAARTRSRGVRRAPFVVLIGAEMPSILAEIGFISNPADEALLMKAAHRQKIADSLARGIQDYAQSLSHVEVASRPAARPSNGGSAARKTAGNKPTIQ